MSEIKDSGERRMFPTGSVRDMAEGKGRFDLMPLDVISGIHDDAFLEYVADYMEDGEAWHLQRAVEYVVATCFANPWVAYLELAKHFENGAKKYGEYNWQKGIESKSYVDSMVRHYCKHEAGYDDEPHAVACLWNLVCCIWTIERKPELNSYAEKTSRCAETTCYYNNDCKCTADSPNPSKGTECESFMED